MKSALEIVPGDKATYPAAGQLTYANIMQFSPDRSDFFLMFMPC
jgi:hypothetical protein